MIESIKIDGLEFKLSKGRFFRRHGREWVCFKPNQYMKLSIMKKINKKRPVWQAVRKAQAEYARVKENKRLADALLREINS